VPVEVVLFLGVFPAIAALAGVALGQWMESRRDTTAHARTLRQLALADRRAQRDAKLARMRAAFQPVLLAAWGFQTVGVDVRHSSKSSTAEARQELLSKAMTGTNEARAQLMMESDVRDVFDEFDRLRAAYSNLVLITYEQFGPAPSQELDKDWSAIKDGVAKIEKLVDAHLRRVEQSGGLTARDGH